MRILVPAMLIALLFSNAFSQKTIETTLDRFNDGSVPYIYVAEMKVQEHLVLLDTREEEEFQVSRIPGATCCRALSHFQPWDDRHEFRDGSSGCGRRFAGRVDLEVLSWTRGSVL